MMAKRPAVKILTRQANPLPLLHLASEALGIEHIAGQVQGRARFKMGRDSQSMRSGAQLIDRIPGSEPHFFRFATTNLRTQFREWCVKFKLKQGGAGGSGPQEGRS